MLARVLGVQSDERAWRIGADGKEKVAAQLEKVAKKDPRWRYLHAIAVGDRGSDIDHLLIGPGGIFTVNAKNHRGAKMWVGGNISMVNGHRQPYVRNARYEAERAAKLLSAICGFPVHVQWLIVTVNAQDVVIKREPEGVNVTWRNNLVKWLLRHGDIHGPDTLDAVYEAARRSTTWRTLRLQDNVAEPMWAAGQIGLDPQRRQPEPECPTRTTQVTESHPSGRTQSCSWACL